MLQRMVLSMEPVSCTICCDNEKADRRDPSTKTKKAETRAQSLLIASKKARRKTDFLLEPRVWSPGRKKSGSAGEEAGQEAVDPAREEPQDPPARGCLPGSHFEGNYHRDWSSCPTNLHPESRVHQSPHSPAINKATRSYNNSNRPSSRRRDPVSVGLGPPHLPCQLWAGPAGEMQCNF